MMMTPSTALDAPKSERGDFPFLTITEAAQLLRVNRRTLDNLRWKGTGPRFRRHGGRIIYHRSELLAWSEQRQASQARRRR